MSIWSLLATSWVRSQRFVPVDSLFHSASRRRFISRRRASRIEQVEDRLLLSATVSDDVDDTVAAFAPATAQNISVTSEWVSQGPGPALDGQVENISPNDEVVGAVHTVVAHPTDADILYIGGTNGGIWKTTNATSASPNWMPLTDEFGSTSIGALTLDPTDATSNTLVAGIGRYSSFGRLGGARIGLLHTTDGGASWNVLDGGGTLVGKNISGVAARGDTIVVSVNTADNFNFSNTGIFRSTDGGTTFTQISLGNGSATGLPGGVSYDLVGDPLDNAVLYTSIIGADSVGGENGIYKSADTGATWTKVSDATIDALLSTDTSNLEIAVGTSNNVYAAVLNNGNPEGFFRSGDGGATWTQMDTPSTNENGVDVGTNPRGGKGPGPGSPLEEIAGGQGSIHFSILADPNDPNIVYVGGDRQPLSNGDTGGFPNSIGAMDFSGRLFRGDASLAAGSQWVHLTHSDSLGAAGGGTANSSSPHADSREMVFDANGNIVEVDDGGIYRRTSPQDNTGDWFSIIGDLQTTEIHDVAYDPISDILISGNQDTGTTEQVGTGSATWRSVSTADGGDVAVDSVTLAANNQSIRYSSFQNLGAFRRRIVDENNNVISTEFPSLTVIGGSPLFPQFKTPFELNAVDPQRILFVGQNSIYESLNQGDTLFEVGPGDGPNFSTFLQDAVAYGGFRDGAANADVFYVGVADEIKVRTDALGGVFTVDPDNSSFDQIEDVVMDADDWETVFAVDDDQVFYSTDAGLTWSDITGNLLSLAGGALQTIEFITGTGIIDGIVVGSRLGGVFLATSADFSEWIEFGTALANAPVWDLYYDATDDVLVAGTLGRGAWTFATASNAINQPPVLTSIDVFRGGIEDTPYTISFEELLAASDASDPEGDPVTFLIDSIVSGTVTKNGVPVTPGSTSLGPGESLVWTPALNDNGIVGAFNVRALDSEFAPSDAVTVRVELAPVNDAPFADAGGPYVLGPRDIIRLDAGDSSDPEQANNTLTYLWDFDNDGQFDDARGMRPYFTRADLNGKSVGVVRLKVIDNEGLYGGAKTMVYAEDPSKLQIAGDSDGVVGQTRRFTLNIVGPVEPQPEYIYLINWGDGRPTRTVRGPSGARFSNIFHRTGTFTVTVTAINLRTGLNTTDTHRVTIGTLQMQGNDLAISGTNGNDEIRMIDRGGNRVEIRRNFSILGTFAVTGAVQAFGLAGNDVFKGDTGGYDVLFDGGSGNDTSYTHDGNNTIYGRNGDDRIIAYSGTNYIHAGDGDNAILTNSGDDRIYTGRGDDVIRDTGGDNYINAGGGNNTITTRRGNDTIISGSGDDKIHAGHGDNAIDAGDGNNDIDTTYGDDIILGGNGVDRVTTIGGSNLIVTFGGDDWIVAGFQGPTLVDPGTGFDIIVGEYDLFDFSDDDDLIDLLARSRN